MKVKGYAARSAHTPLSPFEFERRTPGDKDVEIKIDHCGICHTDIHMVRNDFGMSIYPMVPGHEIVGRVTKVGDRVSRHKVGDLVGVGCLVNSCRACVSCQQGLENYCERGFTLTYSSLEPDGRTPTFGGYSTHIVVDEDFVLRIPEGLDPAGAAPLLCAGITTYSPLRHVGLSKGDKIGIMGLGGLGHMGVKLAASFGAEVTVFSRSASKEGDAKRLGAEHFVLTSQQGSLEPLANHFDFILDTISAKHDISQPLNCLKPQGTFIMVGAPDQPLDLPALPLLFGRRKVMGSLIGGLPETQEMLDHCGTHGITSDIEPIAPDGINGAFERTLKGDVKYRFVIDCSQF